MSKCIEQHTPYFKSTYEAYLKEGFSEKNAEMKTAIDGYKNLFNKLNFFKESIGIKLTAQDKYLKLPDGLETSLYNKEQLAINSFLFYDKNFKILKPYTDIILNNNSSFEDKKLALKSISDQLLAPSTAEKVSEELGKQLSTVIDELGYEAPVESEELKQFTGQTEAKTEELTQEQELKNLKDNLATQTSLMVIKVLKAKIADLEKKLSEKAKPQEEMTDLEKLKAFVNQNPEKTEISAIVPHIFDGSSFEINFDNDEIIGYFEDNSKDYADDFYESFSDKVYTKKSVNINDTNYYFVKHNTLRKFVTFDENMRVLKRKELPIEVIDSSEFKYIENCN